MTPARSRRAETARAASGKNRLDRDLIVAAGLQLAANPSASSISVRELGALLDADPTAIYRHFRSKDHLMQELLDEIIGRSVAAVTADPADWKGRLQGLAVTTLDVFTQYPAIGVEAIVLTTHGPGELGAIEFILDALSRAGLSGDDLVKHYALIASHVLSGAAGIARARSQRGATSDGRSPWLEGPVNADPRLYPHLASVTVQLLGLEDRELFLLGVDSILQSVERTATLTVGSA